MGWRMLLWAVLVCQHQIPLDFIQKSTHMQRDDVSGFQGPSSFPFPRISFNSQCLRVCKWTTSIKHFAFWSCQPKPNCIGSFSRGVWWLYCHHSLCSLSIEGWLRPSLNSHRSRQQIPMPTVLPPVNADASVDSGERKSKKSQPENAGGEQSLQRANAGKFWQLTCGCQFLLRPRVSGLCYLLRRRGWGYLYVLSLS